MNIGIVGHEAAKFTPTTEKAARGIVRKLLTDPAAVLVSGHCPLGGVDIYAEEEALALGRNMLIFAPKENNWERGFKPRNIQIAKNSNECHCISVYQLPATYKGMTFSSCYHCDKHREAGVPTHVKGGGCWTTWLCKGKKFWHIVYPDGNIVSHGVI